jgi:hypothetical protein
VRFWSGFTSLAATHKDEEIKHFMWKIAYKVKTLEIDDD